MSLGWGRLLGRLRLSVLIGVGAWIVGFCTVFVSCVIEVEAVLGRRPLRGVLLVELPALEDMMILNGLRNMQPGKFTKNSTKIMRGVMCAKKIGYTRGILVRECILVPAGCDSGEFRSKL